MDTPTLTADDIIDVIFSSLYGIEQRNRREREMTTLISVLGILTFVVGIVGIAWAGRGKC